MEDGRILSFKPILIEDREVITRYTYSGSFQNCDYAFANMCSWRFRYLSEYSVRHPFLFIRFFVEDEGRKRLAYMFPAGHGDLREAVDLMNVDAEASGHPLLILGVTTEAKAQLEALFPNQFNFIAERDYFDYVYLREDLATLKGKNFQAKRNHINRFNKQYDYTYIPVTQDIIPECMALEQLWYETNKDAENNIDLYHERCSMRFAFEHFDELGLIGGAIAVDHKIISFAYGSPVNQNTFAIHVEKSDVRYDGIFSVICQEFAKHIHSQYVYINREEDLGLPGLRQSKLSYHPYLLLEKSAATKKQQLCVK